MSEMRSIVVGATERSLVLIDEICRGTETAKGTCIAGSIIESLDKIGCLGIVSTHLHGVFSLPLNTSRVIYKAMGTVCNNGLTKPTWKLIDGICRESLAFETAKKEGIPESIIHRAEDLYSSFYSKEVIVGRDEIDLLHLSSSVNGSDDHQVRSAKAEADSHPTKLPVEILHKEVERAIISTCHKKLTELTTEKNTLILPEIRCVLIFPREKPPPSTVGASSVYVMLRPDNKLYVGQSDDLEGRVRAHRSKEGMENASFLYFIVRGKSLACQFETLLINQLPNLGFQLTNTADGKHRNFGTSNLSVESMSIF